MKTYLYVARCSLPGLGVVLERGTVEAPDEGHAYERVDELMWGKYSYISWVEIDLAECDA